MLWAAKEKKKRVKPKARRQMDLFLRRRALMPSAVYSTCVMFEPKMVKVHPVPIRTIAVKSYFQIKCSPSILMDKIVEITSAIEQVEVNKIISANGRIT